MLLLFISFVAGVLTILAPCVLPLLPVIIGGSLGGGVDRRKALTITLSLAVSLILFTLLLKVSSLFVDIPPSVWTWASGGILMIFGLVTLFPGLWETGFMARMSAKSNMMLGRGAMKKSLWGDILVGAALGPIFSTCSPTYFVVLATVLPAKPVLGLIYLLAYVVGLSLSLLAVSLVGQKMMARLDIAADPRGWFKRTLGIIFIIVGLAIVLGLDKRSQTFLLNSGIFDITTVEQKLLQLNNSAPAKQGTLAPELTGIDGYINTPSTSSGQAGPITIGQFKGDKVVLLDIWTYSCINCQRTLPYVKAWYAKYKDYGLEIIGIHTPEFSFEHLLPNVENAVKSEGVEYPVVLDNEYATWNALGNQFWPRKYLVDIDGYIVYDHAGEGSYAETELAIQKALEERKARLGLNINIPVGLVNPNDAVTVSSGLGSPETYFGSARNEYLANGTAGISGIQTLTLPKTFNLNELNLGGKWNFTQEYGETAGPAAIDYKFKAKNVYFVASDASGTDADVYVDGKLLKTVHIQAETLYQLVSGSDYSEHLLEIKVKGPGLRAFTFTFG